MTKAAKKTPAKAAPAKSAPAKAIATPKVSAPAADAAEGTDKLGKTGLTEQVSAQTSLSRIQSASVIDAVLDVVITALKDGKTVGLPGLGTFSVKATAARQGVRPGTSEKITIAAGKKVSYKVALDLKKTL